MPNSERFAPLLPIRFLRRATLALVPFGVAGVLPCLVARAADAPDPVAPAPMPPVPSAEPPPAIPDPATAGPSRPFSVDFEGLPAGRVVPEGFLPVDGNWTVADDATKPGKNHVLRQDKTVPTWATVLSTGEGHAIADGKISVRFQPISGREDASGGIVFRARDGGNYYLARANALEDNLQLFVVKAGRRWDLASTRVEPPKLGAWHTLEVEVRGDAFHAVLDGKDSVDAKDKTFASGWTGLWTKSDSVTNFDDFAVQPAGVSPAIPPLEPPASPAPPPPAPPRPGMK